MNKVLFSFSLLWDIEFGLYKHIMSEYDEDYFKFKFKDDKYLKNIIMYRKDLNPLSKICTDITKEKIDKLYEEIMKSEYDNIISNVIKTDFFGFIDTIRGTKRYEPNVLCKNVKEEQICIENELVPVYIENINLADYYSLYFRYFDEVDLSDIQGMNVYFSNTVYNLLNKKELLPISINNVIRFIDLYNIKKPI